MRVQATRGLARWGGCILHDGSKRRGGIGDDPAVDNNNTTRDLLAEEGVGSGWRRRSDDSCPRFVMSHSTKMSLPILSKSGIFLPNRAGGGGVFSGGEE